MKFQLHIHGELPAIYVVVSQKVVTELSLEFYFSKHVHVRVRVCSCMREYYTFLLCLGMLIAFPVLPFSAFFNRLDTGDSVAFM